MQFGARPFARPVAVRIMGQPSARRGAKMRVCCKVPLLQVLACALIGAACADDGSERAMEAKGVAAEGQALRRADPGVALVPPGEVRVSRDGTELMGVVAADAPRGAILAALAERAEFSVMIGEGARLEERLTLRASKERMELVLARVLAGVPHALAYAPDAGPGARRLTLVTVGQPATATGGGAASVPTVGTPAQQRRPGEVDPAKSEQRAERSRELWAKSLEHLESSDPELRADGARWLDVGSSEGFDAAVSRLESDESAEVRAAAAESLIDADADAVPPLVQALEDRDPGVVMAALEALEFVGDEATAPQLRVLLNHKDPEVRERARKAIEFLE
jgi:hypothetical protein